MADKLVGEDRGVVEHFDDIDGQRRYLRQHYTPERVRSLEVEVLDDEMGALAVGLDMAVLARHGQQQTKRAVYLKEAHVYRVAFWVVVHRVGRVGFRGRSGCGVSERQDSGWRLG